MADYRIVCTDQTECSQDGHIIGVGLGESSGKANERLTVKEIYAAMDAGDRFYTRGATSGKTAWVRKFDCPCGRGSLKSAPDRTTDNNLDNLRLCSWKS